MLSSFNNTNPLIYVNLSDQPQGMYFVKYLMVINLQKKILITNRFLIDIILKANLNSWHTFKAF
jgi:hypothetical protein